MNIGFRPLLHNQLLKGEQGRREEKQQHEMRGRDLDMISTERRKEGKGGEKDIHLDLPSTSEKGRKGTIQLAGKDGGIRLKWQGKKRKGKPTPMRGTEPSGLQGLTTKKLIIEASPFLFFQPRREEEEPNSRRQSKESNFPNVLERRER